MSSVWTDKKPTKVGYYWYKYAWGGNEEIVEVRDCGYLYAAPYTPIEKMHGQWSNKPIRKPKKAPASGA